ncbi:MAG TPA: hypothetical protein VFB39_07845 [Solirubrobacteraceae bacterium]|nr:hypothetical protein [Solirubrobacteraceae bacterium]
MLGKAVRVWLTRLSVVSIAVALIVAAGGSAAAGSGAQTSSGNTGGVTSSSLGTFSPTFAGPAATGCGVDCHLLTGPFNTPSTAAAASGHRLGTAHATRALPMHGMAPPDLRRLHLTAAQRRAIANGTRSYPVPSVSCAPLSRSCDQISTTNGGATGVKGLNAVDSGSMPTNPLGDVEPPDQGLCANSGFVVETNNIGEIMVFNTALKRKSGTIPLDTLMGLTKRGWSSGGDPSCLYDPSNGGHWIFTEIVSANTEKSGGPFTGCFSGVANKCYEGIAVTDGSSPFGPYHVYFSSADYNPAEPGYPSLLNDFAKISVTRDAFLMFYDEFPLLPGTLPGMGGGIFNGAQEFAFRKSALEQGLPARVKNGKPNPALTVARENMGLIRTPDGTCAKDKILHMGGITCWVAVIPAQPIAGQFDNSHGGTGFMVGSLDFYGFVPLATSGDNRIAAWAWTGLSALNSSGCSGCKSGIRFQGQLFSGVNRYYDPETVNFGGIFAPQRTGPIPLGNDCSVIADTTGPCPEGGITTNGDNLTQVSQAQGQLWTAAPTQLAQTYSRANAEIHMGAVYWVVGTRSFDTSRRFTLTGQGYVSPKHEDLSMPAMAATPTTGGKAIMLFTLTGNGGPTGADHGGFFPSTAYGRLTSTSGGLLNSRVNIADMGKSPQDGFSEYQFFPGATRPRWGDYSWGLFVPNTGGRIYFANEYIQYPNCTGKAFNPNAIGTCGGTRDGRANWGTSVNYVVP